MKKGGIDYTPGTAPTKTRAPAGAGRAGLDGKPGGGKMPKSKQDGRANEGHGPKKSSGGDDRKRDDHGRFA